MVDGADHQYEFSQLSQYDSSSGYLKFVHLDAVLVTCAVVGRRVDITDQPSENKFDPRYQLWQSSVRWCGRSAVVGS